MMAFRTMKPTIAEYSAAGISGAVPATRSPSPVDLAEHRVDRPHDRDHVRHLAADENVRQDREIREGGAAPLHPVGLGAAVGDEITAHLAPRAFDPRIRLSLGNADLAHGLH